jgi:TadE-like protein
MRARGEAGNAPLELVLIAPLILILIGLVIAAGRVSTAQDAVDAAARDAARQASVAANEGLAADAAQSSAESALSADGLQCQPVISMPGLAAAFDTPIGTPAEVRALVTCVVQLSDVLVPGVPGTITLHARFSSPLDPFRSRDLSFLTPEVPNAARSG